MQMLPYNHEMVHMFSKEMDYVIHTKYGQTRIAGLFQHYNKNDPCKWKWVTAENEEIIDGEDITHWSAITF